MGDLRHLCGRHSADPAVPPVHLYQVLLQREEEEAAAEEGREDQPERCERENHHGSGEWMRNLQPDQTRNQLQEAPVLIRHKPAGRAGLT